MARNEKSSGGFNRFLNFIGIVDEPKKNPQSQSFNSGSGYGQAEPYSPGRQQPSSRNSAKRNGSDRSIPSQGSRSNPGSRRVYDDDSQYVPPRRPSRFEENSQQDFAPQQRQPRQPRYEDEPAAAPVRSAPRTAPRASGQTFVCTVTVLKEVRPIITSMIRGDTIHLNIYSEEEQRILDTLSGAAFALNYRFRKPQDFPTYILAPETVNIADLLESDD